MPKRIAKFFIIVAHACYRKLLPIADEGMLLKEMNMFDVTLLTIGNTIGYGSYITIGNVTAAIGPALILTNLLTGSIIIMTGLCYASFIRRENSGGSAYTCAFQKLGEIHAGLIGCLLTIEHVAATALIGRGASNILDLFFGNEISNRISNYMTFESPLLGDYPDVVGFFISILSLALVSYPVKTIYIMNNTAALINLGLMCLITMVNGSNMNFKNWSIPAGEKCGSGGFMPYGMGSVFKAMSSIYLLYIGYDTAGQVGVEVKEAERIIPLSILLSLMVICVLVALHTLTYPLVWTYCDQNIERPIPDVMRNIKLDIMKWITVICIPIGVIGNYMCNFFSATRLLYTMAEDGLLYSFLAKVDQDTKNPIYAWYITGILIGVYTLYCDIKMLSQITCLAAICAYSLVAYGLLQVNYLEDEMEYGRHNKSLLKLLLNTGNKATTPTVITSTIVRICCWIIFLTSFPFLMFIKWGYPNLLRGNYFEIILCVIIFLFYLLITVVISRQPQTRDIYVKKVQLVPVVPVLVILSNTHLVMEISIYAWIHTFIWILLFLIIYLAYGMWNSKARVLEKLYQPKQYFSYY